MTRPDARARMAQHFEAMNTRPRRCNGAGWAMLAIIGGGVFVAGMVVGALL